VRGRSTRTKQHIKETLYTLRRIKSCGCFFPQEEEIAGGGNCFGRKVCISTQHGSFKCFGVGVVVHSIAIMRGSRTEGATSSSGFNLPEVAVHESVDEYAVLFTY